MDEEKKSVNVSSIYILGKAKYTNAIYAVYQPLKILISS